MRVCLEAGEGRGVGPLVEFLLLSFGFVWGFVYVFYFCFSVGWSIGLEL